MSPRSSRQLPFPQPRAAKVPEIIIVFWILKILTTGMGEAMSDYLGQQSIPLAAVVGLFGLAIALWIQFRAREYQAPAYWFAVMMVAVFGTMAADGLHRGAGIPYAVTTPFFVLVVAAVFVCWQRVEGTLSIHTITTRRRETFYWAAVLATFALGTALGDLTAITLNLGYLPSAVLFGVLIAIPALLWWRGAINPVLAFWAAYVVTRPLGASIADWFSKSSGKSGLGLGDGLVSVIAFAIFVVLVAYVAVTKPDIQVARRSARDGVRLPLVDGGNAQLKARAPSDV
jgi:uncharacterized membrane-anchored protein